MATYDPNKKYTWHPNDKFVITGEQFGFILNSFRAILSTPEAQRILLVNHANTAVENIMAKLVENDEIKEVNETQDKEAS